MDHSEALNRILSHMAPLATDGGNGRTFQFEFDNLPVTIEAIRSGDYLHSDGSYDYSYYRINDLKIG